MTLLLIFGDRCQLPAEAEDARDKGSRARVWTSLFCGYSQIPTPQEAH